MNFPVWVMNKPVRGRSNQISAKSGCQDTPARILSQFDRKRGFEKGCCGFVKYFAENLF
jgi:hypothetical protein